jgi:hypothetical protein
MRRWKLCSHRYSGLAVAIIGAVVAGVFIVALGLNPSAGIARGGADGEPVAVLVAGLAARALAGGRSTFRHGAKVSPKRTPRPGSWGPRPRMALLGGGRLGLGLAL